MELLNVSLENEFWKELDLWAFTGLMPVGSSFIASNCAKKMLSISKFAIDSGLAIIYTSVTNLVEKRPIVIGITGAILGCVLAFGISREVEKLYEKLTVGVSRLCQQTTKNMNLIDRLWIFSSNGADFNYCILYLNFQ